MKNILFLLAGTILCLTGCTSKTRLAAYNPVIEEHEKNNISLKIKGFEDVRPEGRQIGANRNLYWMPLIKIVTDDSIPDWVTNAFKVELTNAGYSIVDSDFENNYSLEGKIIKLFANTHFLYHGRMAVEISLKKGDETLFQKLYKTNEDGGINWIASDYMCAETLKYNLQEICRRSIADINQHILETSSDPDLTLRR
jgi:hypothetical protein